MKATRKIVGAACALVAAVALSAGSTFAWFTSNGVVTATGLEVDVSTNNAYLIIADSAANLSKGWKTISLENVGKVTSGEGENVTTAPVQLLPSSYKTATVTGTGDDATATLTDPTTNAPGDATCVTKVGNWFTAQGTTSTNGTIDNSTKTVLTEFAGYVVTTDIYVSVAGTVAVKDVNMTIDATTWSKTNEEATNNDPISVLILYRTLDVDDSAEGAATATATEWNRKELNAGNNHMLGTDTANYLKVNTEGDLDATKYIEIHVMVYFDGHHADVNTMNQINLTGVKLDFTFTDPATASNESNG